jgi:general secretion pathway protein G
MESFPEGVMMKTRAKMQRGFTLVEVLLVLAILVGLGALAVTTLFGERESANVKETTARMQQVKGKLEQFRNEFNRYPDEELGGLQALVEKPDFGDEALNEKWRPLITERDKLKDAWGTELEYEVVTDASSGVEIEVPKLTSAGPDRELGTDDDIVMGPDEDME